VKRMDKAALLARARRQQSAGHYDQAIFDYSAALDLPTDAPLLLWQQRSSTSYGEIVELLRAIRELEVSRIAIDEYLGTERLAGPYQGFAPDETTLSATPDRTRALAQIVLRLSGSSSSREDLETLLDIIEEEVGDPRSGPSLFAYPQLQPLYARLHFIMARQLLDASNCEDAHGHLVNAITLAPCYGPAHRSLGEALIGLGRGVAAARHFDCAAAFWNPHWWSITFPPGTQMRLPGIVVRGYDIFFWKDTFLAIKINPAFRRLRLLALQKLRESYSSYRLYAARRRQSRSEGTLRRAIQVVVSPILILCGALARQILRIPGAPRLLSSLHPFVLPAMARLLRGVLGAAARLRHALRLVERVAAAWRAWLFPPGPTAAATPRRRWRTRIALWLARLEVMWGAQSTLRAASLPEILELLETADTDLPARIRRRRVIRQLRRARLWWSQRAKPS
jgi:tetratricopeptide (TPR) repeat protein